MVHNSSHIPVLLNEVISALNPKQGEFFIDGTVGSGGHARQISEKIGNAGKLLGIDWDLKAISNLKSQMANFGNVILKHGNYADLPEILEKSGLPKADGLVVDLGFSSEQLESVDRRTGRGFSFLKDEILDMRYFSESGLTAAEIVNSFPENKLSEIFRNFGEERFSGRIAKKIVEARRKKRILTTKDLVEIIAKAVPKNYERGRIHPATRTFQALRIFVNEELENLESFLEKIPDVLSKNGRAAVISFHSLEDRIVKNNFRKLEKEGIAEIINKKPITASENEIKENPRSRSAKLRAILIK